jgi:putative cardiolipin synthase
VPAQSGPGPIESARLAHPGLSGSYVLERGEQALLARAWLADHARHSIEVQYFIWSTDNIGILASEALLRAADRGVAVRVIVDDLMMEAPDETLLALARHPRIDIRIYNPVHSVGVPWYRRLLNLVTDFRGANQRMHDKTMIVDGEFAIAGGRNMADEYFDYDHAYNFRDRDALVAGPVVAQVRASFERFWVSPLAVPVERLYAGYTLMQKHVSVGEGRIREIYAGLHAHAADRANFRPEVHAALDAITADVPQVLADVAWGRVDFLCDLPGKNDGSAGLGGGGESTAALAALLRGARREVLIQSPYLVLSDPAFALLRELVARGVTVRISTNSLASTDNLQAFGGYLAQRSRIVASGIDVREYRPDPAVQREVMQRYDILRAEAPVFAIHAKTLVVDRETVVIGTYNLDPRSENLNTEVGLVIHHAGQARAVAAAIERDLEPANSWNAATDDPDAQASLGKRLRAWFWGLMPIRALL